MMKILKTFATTGLLLVAFSCEQGDEVQNVQPLDDSPVFMDLPQLRDQTNGRTSSQYTILSAEYITAGESEKIGRTVYFNNVGNKQLGADFVPDLALDGTNNVSFYIEENRPSADLAVGQTSAAIGRAMQTWDELTCSELGMYRVPSNPAITTGFVSKAFGFGGSFNYTADIVHSGWMPPAFFDELVPGGSNFILAVTFTLIFFENGQPTDFDNNGKYDVAWREIYYNDKFPWADGSHYDVETIALHEAGHGLSQGHFGKAFRTDANSMIHFSPRAVMNAAYTGIQTVVDQTDNGGHCSIWSSWPHQ